MSQEIILGLALISGIFAFLYSKTPEENTSFRILYLGLTLFSITFLIWIMASSGSQITETKIYNSTGDLTGTEITNSTIGAPITSGLVSFMNVSLWLDIIVLSVILIMFIYEGVKSSMEQRKKDEIGEV